MRIDVLHTGFDNLTMEEAVNRTMELIAERGSEYIVTPNPEIVWMCRKDAQLREIIRHAAMVLPDGIGIIYGAKILGRPLKEKVSGADFAEKVIEKLASQGGGIFLFGAKPGVAELAGEKLSEKYSGLRIVGTANGYFEDDAPIIKSINEARPDMLLVCLGAPKQERWMSENKDKLSVGVMVGLGGSLDVYAGTVQRAPEMWRKLNIEWLFRLIKQPSRFVRMLRLPAFLVAVIWQRIRGK